VVVLVCLGLLMRISKRLHQAADTSILYTHSPFTIPCSKVHLRSNELQAALQSCITKHSRHASLSSKQLPLKANTPTPNLFDCPDDSETACPLSIRSRLSTQTRSMLLPTTAAYCCLALVYLVCLRGLRCKRRAPWHHWGCIRDLRWRIEGE